MSEPLASSRARIATDIRWTRSITSNRRLSLNQIALLLLLHFMNSASWCARLPKNSILIFQPEISKNLRPRIREVVFLDTKDFSLYNNSFIFRRRVAYEDGFPVGNPEIVFKFRHPDLQTAAEMDVRPNILGEYRIKFKAEALPLKEKLGGYRLLYSHNVELELQREMHSTSMAALADFFPALNEIQEIGQESPPSESHDSRGSAAEIFGVLDFGKGVTAKSNASLWRERGEHKLLIGEFAFECRFKREDELHAKTLEKVKRFFVLLQDIAGDWISLGTTKTGIVYRLKGNPPQSHE